jgi:hypothetical protein
MCPYGREHIWMLENGVVGLGADFVQAPPADSET